MFSSTNYQFSSPKVSPYQDIITVAHDGKYITNDYYRHSEKNRKRRYSPCCLFFCILCTLLLIGIVVAAILMGIFIKPNTTPSTTTTLRTRISTATTISTVTTASTVTTISTVTTTSSTQISTVTTTVITDSTATTEIICLPTCTSQQRCVKGVCVGIGFLSCTLTWSRPGDGDIVVATPDNKLIHFSNKGPSVNTSQGQLDVDDRNGTGPENVFWSSSSSLPPTGIYYICFSQYNFTLNASVTNPITATVKVDNPPNVPLTFTKTFTSPYDNYEQCDSTSSNLLGSFPYP